jgi:2-iminobutanoate/2-iminopropanoate deaminase
MSSGLPFSPLREAGGLVFLAGQGGFDPATGELAGDSIEEQTEQTLRNVAALLEQAGCSLADVVSCLVHLSDLELFERFNEVYARHFAEPRPVRTTVGAPLVRGMLVEITAVARRA